MSGREQTMSKHTQKIDQQAHMDELEREGPDPRAVERFRRPPYRAALQHKTVVEYVAEKFRICREDDADGNDKRSIDKLPEQARGNPGADDNYRESVSR